jgi:predicted transcriptional regulator
MWGRGFFDMVIKNSGKLEKIVKGAANHYRIDVLALLSQRLDLSLLDISKLVGMNFKTASEHIKKLHNAGLVSKKYKNREIQHNLTDLGKQILIFLRMLEQRNKAT